MSEEYTLYTEPMHEMFLFETNQFMEQFEEILINLEKSKNLSEECINEIFRIMHTIKGSSSMMMYDDIAKITHSLEELFFYIRENNIKEIDCLQISDIGFLTLDLINGELIKIQGGDNPYGNDNLHKSKIEELLNQLGKDKNMSGSDMILKELEAVNEASAEDDIAEHVEKKYSDRVSVKVIFEENCQMENMRAFAVVNCLSDKCTDLEYYPEELFEDESSTNHIIEDGFFMTFKTELSGDELYKLLYKQLYVEEVIIEGREDEIIADEKPENMDTKYTSEETGLQDDISKNETFILSDIDKPSLEAVEMINKSKKKNIISINVDKMDKLMDLVGEIVITESMVTKNPDLKGLELDNFGKAARQLRKLNDELQDIVMSMRMIPIGPTFHKMHRIVRDMNKNLNKSTELIITGEETEVDKNIIDSLGDPLMHIIRNSLDHGIESSEERLGKGKSEKGSIMLDAVNTGGDVIIRISDDGRGLDKESILRKARENELLIKPESEMTDREIYSMILLPGFSTKEDVTEYSGRGVGMDVVKRNIEKNGGAIQIESEENKGISISIKIPLTLAIIEGMKISVGDTIFTVPTTSIRESFKIKKEDIIRDTSGNEMVMIRGNCYPIVRLHEKYGIKTECDSLLDGIIMMVEAEDGSICIFGDELIGEQQVVVKPVPPYLGQYVEKNSGVAGCAILGDGKISLILDIIELSN
jgi:two-component system chemotaxis sensor kinase CheA